MSEETADIIDQLTGASPGSALDALRVRRPVTKEHAQKSYLALFEPQPVSEASLAERFAIALFVAELHEAAEATAFYGAKLAAVEGGAVLAEAVKAAAAEGRAKGPYGRYPAGPLSAEDVDGPVFRASAGLKEKLGGRLTAALEHAHLLVFHLRDSEPAALGRLLDAGWSTAGIVTISQLVAFLSFQLRVVAGLRALAA